MRQAFFLSIFAAATTYGSAKPACEQPKVCCEEPKPGPFAFNFPVDRDIACSQNFYVYGEGLAFQAKQINMEFAAMVDNIATIPALSGELAGFDDDHHGWKYQPGMRLGLGSYFNHDAWNFNCNWTWLHITNYKTVRPTSTTILPFWYFGIGPDQIPPNTITATSVWNASYNVLDLQLGKPYQLSGWLKCLLHAGARLGWIDQHLSQRYGFQVNSNAINPIMHGDSNFWCVGGRVGLDTDWLIGKGWSLFANISGSMSNGTFLIKQKNEPTQDPTNPTQGIDNINIRRHMHANILNLESAFGLSWQQHFMNNKYLVSMKAGYEFIHWFDQLNFRRFYNTQPNYTNDMISRGTLTLNGFSLRLQLDI